MFIGHAPLTLSSLPGSEIFLSRSDGAQKQIIVVAINIWLLRSHGSSFESIRCIGRNRRGWLQWIIQTKMLNIGS
jgi:hypothetical protein